MFPLNPHTLLLTLLTLLLTAELPSTTARPALDDGDWSNDIHDLETQGPVPLPPDVYREDLRPQRFSFAQTLACIASLEFAPCCAANSHPRPGEKECILKWGDQFYDFHMTGGVYYNGEYHPPAPPRPKPEDELTAGI